MALLKRIGLFVLTQALILVTVALAMTALTTLFGIDLSGQSGSVIGLFVFSLVAGFAGALISLFMSKRLAKWQMGVKTIDLKTASPQERWIVETVHLAAKRAKLPKMPEVGIYDAPDINAFATGPSKSNSLVAVSTGLLYKMNRDEVEGVLGHEVAHIANGDMVTMTLIQGIVNTFVIFLSRIVANILASQVDSKYRTIAYFGSAILFDLLFGILGSLVVALYSRKREFRADFGSAKLVGKEKMIAALEALKNDKTIPIVHEEEAAIASLRISSRPVGLAALLSTHPPLESRIKALQRARV